MPDERRTRATFRRAEFGFFGVVVYTRVHTPRFCGLPFRAGVFFLSTDFLRPLRTSWLMVGKIFSFCICLRRCTRPPPHYSRVSKCVQLIRTRKPCPFRSASWNFITGYRGCQTPRTRACLLVLYRVLAGHTTFCCSAMHVLHTISRKVVAKVANRWASRFCQSEQASPKPCNGRKIDVSRTPATAPWALPRRRNRSRHGRSAICEPRARAARLGARSRSSCRR